MRKEVEWGRGCTLRAVEVRSGWWAISAGSFIDIEHLATSADATQVDVLIAAMDGNSGELVDFRSSGCWSCCSNCCEGRDDGVLCIHFEGEDV